MSENLTPTLSSTKQAEMAPNASQSTHTMLTQHINLSTISSYKMDPKLTDRNWQAWKKYSKTRSVSNGRETNK
ncbi:hypothetical protein PAXRUDRAFT_22778 [Paxillus rubicundulus Ve08.2h10]|uniref:Uncharacterized protein n=1 Tax=Paxillus rubicundulus Ve08.2h10 TaxID=930991 RepID=A0A0D0CMM2_9AGAM|nr:hypothetical protein PAXRUDRAFT_22778 [Paxillus rubicundulus Ve08.2h10]